LDGTPIHVGEGIKPFTLYKVEGGLVTGSHIVSQLVDFHQHCLKIVEKELQCVFVFAVPLRVEEALLWDGMGEHCTPCTG
jgi:hypothetical protein